MTFLFLDGWIEVEAMHDDRIGAMKQFLVKILKPIAGIIANRDKGLRKEIEFWDNWLATRGGEWSADFDYRINPDSPVKPWHSSLIDSVTSEPVDVLDVGAGPITSFGYKHHSKVLQLCAVDPLANEYNELLERYAIKSVVATRSCSGEELESFFGGLRFDIVNARNSLDHAVDPVQCIRSMYRVCKVHGFITLIHAENEAINNVYSGLHQWNFSLKGNKLHVQGDLYEKFVDDEFSGVIEWEHGIEKGIIHSAGKKIH